MAAGRKTGGRKKGSVNKISADAAAIMDRLKCDPIEGMVRVAQHRGSSLELQGKMYAELSKYKHPQRKAVELSGDKEAPVKFVFERIGWRDDSGK